MHYSDGDTMILVVAEKPSVAMAIAKVLDARQRKDGYVEGNGYYVSWCVGHLVGFCDASEYDARYEKWRYEDLPILPEEWKTKILEGTKKQFQILKKLMNAKQVTEVVCATDSAKEGELIFRLVYEQANCRKKVKRLWISSMEEDAIRKGFQNMKDGSCYDDLYQSALCRAKADWIVGINASRLFSVLYNKNLKVGRVQTPTLAMIVERNQKIQEFKKEKYYEVHLKDGDFDAVSRKYKDRSEAAAIAEKCQKQICEVVKDDKQKKSVRPPRLYDLTTLQRDANRLFGYTAKETLDIAQSLYEAKLLTYPRTDSQFLTDDMEEYCRKLMKVIFEKYDFKDVSGEQMNISQVLNSSKVSDHHAIMLTMELKHIDISKRSQKEQDILMLVASRILTAANAPYIYESHKCEVHCQGESFTTSVRHVLQEGFRVIQNQYYALLGKKQEEEAEKDLDIHIGSKFGPCNAEIQEKDTQPPRQFTEDTLLAFMETAGREDLDEDAEKKGLGTPATRAGIIEKLVSSGFVKREKKNLVPTEEGNVLITIIPEELRSPKMTAEWENALNKIAKGEKEPEEFLNEISSMIRKLIDRYQGISEKPKNTFPKKETKERESIGSCPRCGSAVYEGDKGYYCSKKECRFCLWKETLFFKSQGKEINTAAAKKLLKDGKIYYKNLRSQRTGKTYAATIVMKDTAEGVKFDLQFPQR